MLGSRNSIQFVFVELSALLLLQTTEKDRKMLSPGSTICELLSSDQYHGGGLGELWNEAGFKLACSNCLPYIIAEVLAHPLPLLMRERILAALRAALNSKDVEQYLFPNA